MYYFYLFGFLIILYLLKQIKFKENFQSPNDSNLGPNDSNLGPNDSDLGPNDSNLGPNDSNLGPNDSNLGPNDSNLGPNDSNLGPNDSDLGPNESDYKSPNLKLEFYFIDPKFNKQVIKDGKFVSKNDWKDIINNDFCKPMENKSKNTSLAKVNECSCLNLGNKYICGKKFSNYIYQCPNMCEYCNKCHSKDDKNILKCRNKKKCKEYREKLLFFKEYYKEEKINNQIIEKNMGAKNLYKKTLIRDFLTNNDIIIRIVDDNKTNIKIKIQKLFLDGKKVNYDIFYEDLDEIYLFIPVEDRHSGLNKKLLIDGYYQSNKKYRFTLEDNLNIYIYKPPKDKEIKNPKMYQENVESILVDDFADNYLKQSKLVSYNLVKNPKVINDIKYKELGEFKKKDTIDSPETWANRIDINRPWISTYKNIVLDIFNEYNPDMNKKDINYGPAPSNEYYYSKMQSIDKEKLRLQNLEKKKLQRIKFKNQKKK